jgi:branched-chain amino acid transport system substrate-binding protein
MRKINHGLRVAAVALAAFAAPAWAQQGEPVKIGVLIGLTGSSAVAGNDSYKCMQIAADEVNAAGGVLGRPIKLVVQDDEGRPKGGVDGANLLADVEKVSVAIGGYSSGIALPAGQVFNEKKVVWVTDATTNKLKTVGPYVFDTAGLDELRLAGPLGGQHAPVVLAEDQIDVSPQPVKQHDRPQPQAHQDGQGRDKSQHQLHAEGRKHGRVHSRWRL